MLTQRLFFCSQVNVLIEDKNDNSPRFDSSSVRIAVPENVATGSPVYTAHATDPDSGANGEVHYELIASTQEPSYFQVDHNRGTISLIHGLDYETVHRLTVTVIARDSGATPLSDNMTLVVDVQDINDNPPVFERPHYAANVLESLPVNSQVSATYPREHLVRGKGKLNIYVYVCKTCLGLEKILQTLPALCYKR